MNGNRLALDVLDRQVDVLRWLAEPDGIAEQVMDLLLEYRNGHRIEDLTTPAPDAGLAAGVAHNLAQATTYWVSEPMTELLVHAWPSLELEAIRLAELPAPCGWVEFAEPIAVPQEHPRFMPRFDAVSWWDQETGVESIGPDGTVGTYPGVIVMWWRTVEGFIADNAEWNAEPEEMITHRRVMKGTPLEPIWTSGYAYDLDPKRQGYLTDAPGVMQRQSLRTLWLLLAQELPALTTVTPPRGQARRLGRALGEVPEVTVVDLRRQRKPRLVTDKPGEIDLDAEIHWSHRWVVNGHWRNQPYGPKRSLRRRIWIFPYEKGPEDKPLVVKDRVYRLVK